LEAVYTAGDVAAPADNFPAGIRRFPWVIPFRRPCSEKHGIVLNMNIAPTIFEFVGLEIQGYGNGKT